MRQIILLPSVLFGFLSLTQSCTKQSHEGREKNSPETITASVSAKNPYTLDITNLGTVSISKQAGHFSVSQTMSDEKQSALVYKYSPSAGYTGKDEVELSVQKTTYFSGGGGCGNGSGGSSGYTGTYISRIVIKFDVTE